MDSQIDEIKRRLDILDVVSDYVPVKKAGRNYKGLCPFHTEKTPSFMVNPERGIFKCFGCGKGGDAFRFIMEVENLEFPEALRVLAKRAGITLKEYRPSPQAKLREKVLAAQESAAKFYQTVLLEHDSGKVALDYLKKRGLTPATIKAWGLGYAPNQWELVTRALASKGYSSDEIIASGLGVASDRGRSPYDRFRGRVMFPIRDITGKVIGFSGRILGEGEPKYMNSPDSLVFQKSNVLYGMDLAKNEVKKANLAVLVEGNIDVLSSHQAGVKNAVAPLGTALTSGQIGTLSRFTDAVALAFDSDIAGDAATRRGIEMAEDAGLNIRVVHLEGHDPDDMIQTSPKSWAEAVLRATPIYDFYLDSAFAKADATTAEGKRRIAREVLPAIKKITDPILRAHYLKLVASKLGLEERDLELALSRVPDPGVKATSSANPVETKHPRQYLIEEEIIKLTLELRRRVTLLIPDDFTEPHLQKIYQALIKYFGEVEKEGDRLTATRKFDTQSFVKLLPTEVVPTFDDIILKLRPEEELDDEVEKKVLSEAARELRRGSLRRLLRKLGLMIKQAEANGLGTEVDKLSSKFREYSTKLAQLEATSAQTT